MRRVGRPSNARASSIPIAASPDLIPIVVVGGCAAAVDVMVIAVVAAGQGFFYNQWPQLWIDIRHQSK